MTETNWINSKNRNFPELDIYSLVQKVKYSNPKKVRSTTMSTNYLEPLTKIWCPLRVWEFIPPVLPNFFHLNPDLCLSLRLPGTQLRIGQTKLYDDSGATKGLQFHYCTREMKSFGNALWDLLFFQVSDSIWMWNASFSSVTISPFLWWKTLLYWLCPSTTGVPRNQKHPKNLLS